MYQIRQETPSDYDGVYTLVKEAFATATHSDGTEQDLVVSLRKGDYFIPQLSLVAEEDGVLAGHILLTRAALGDRPALLVAPLSVLPAYQGQGIGGALLHAAHAKARELGFDYALLVGHETYYPRFGYRPAAGLGITAPFAVPAENFMVLSLSGDETPVNAALTCAPELSH